MSRLSDLLRQVERTDAQLAADLRAEVKALSERRQFGLNFERHVPEAVDLPGRPVRRGDKVRVLPPRGSTAKPDARLGLVLRVADGVATIVIDDEATQMDVDDLVVVAEFRDPIFPGLVSTGKVERGGDKPFHSVISAENFHALEALLYTHEGKVDAIYIDPPYNTGAKDWKYNNDYVDGDDAYRHSKWLAFMERRLQLAKRLLNPDNSVLIVTIDEKEYLRLGLLLQQSFGDARFQMISTQINPAAVARAGQFGRSDEYIFVVSVGVAAPQRVSLSRDWVSAKGRTHTGTARWDLLRRSGEGAAREDSPGCFYPVYVDPKSMRVAQVGEALPSGSSEPLPVAGTVAVLPIRKDGSEGRWQWTPSTFRGRLEQGRIRVSGSESRGFAISILKDGEYGKVVAGEFGEIGRRDDGSLDVGTRESDRVLAIPGTQWRVSSHDATQYGSRLLANVLPSRRFPFPKSLYAVEDALRFFVSDKPDAVVLDFFSGSGTTAHAVMRLNKQDGGRRQCISVTNNEVSAEEQKRLREQGLRPGDPEWERWGICDYITKPRIEAAITGRTPDGEPIKGDYKFTDEFPMADGFEENVEFFTMTYEAPRAVQHGKSFEAIAPLLWLKAGARGRRIDVPAATFDIADTYGVLFDVDAAGDFLAALAAATDVRMAFVVTDDERAFQLVCNELPEAVEPVRLYESYLTSFAVGGSA
ncbi:site-specific DNA-methyltransferase [Nocardioides ultimimeridianus]